MRFNFQLTADVPGEEEASHGVSDTELRRDMKEIIGDSIAKSFRDWNPHAAVAITDAEAGSLEDFRNWYRTIYTEQQLGWGNSMTASIATIEDGISTYRDWLQDGSPNPMRTMIPARAKLEPIGLMKIPPGPFTAPGGFGALEHPSQIDIDARGISFRFGDPPPRFFRCGNCGAKLPMTGDPEKDHHTAQAHTVEQCSKRVQAAVEHRHLVEEHAMQLSAAKTAPKQIGDGRPWWKFW